MYKRQGEADRAAMRQMEERAMQRVSLLRTEETSMTDQQLFDLACEAMHRAYTPYSNFKVGACLLSSDGRTFQGCNIENASYGATICAAVSYTHLDVYKRQEKITVPLGVIGIIFEARPNVTSDAAALCLKSGNACILRGGKEAIRSNTAIANAMRAALGAAGLDENCICLIEDTDRETATAMMRLNRYIDCLIPRGGAGLIRSVVENATVPVRCV